MYVVLCSVRNRTATQEEEAMKWKDLCNTLTICDREDQPDCDISGDFERMAKWEAFALAMVHVVNDEAGNAKTLLMAEQFVHVKVQKVVVTDICPQIVLTCKTIGVLPPGIVHGTYVLEFEDGKDCYEPPAQMFEDSEVPEDELSHWHS